MKGKQTTISLGMGAGELGKVLKVDDAGLEVLWSLKGKKEKKPQCQQQNTKRKKEREENAH